jgi:mono/diheme cytochrome c family protein
VILLAAAFLLQPAPDSGAVTRGARIFAQSCAVGYCHGTAGAANRGPRLAGRGFDSAYVNKVIREGIPGTAMPGFSRWKPADLDAVIAYVMKISGGGSTGAAPSSAPAPTKPTFPGPPDAQAGKDLFFDATRQPRCATCHAVEDWGVAVGPNLAAKPPSSPAAIRSAKPNSLCTVTTKDGDRFAALPAGSNQYYDLSTPLPVLRTFQPGEATVQPGANWSHASVTKSYSDSELARIAAYLKWVASR